MSDFVLREAVEGDLEQVFGLAKELAISFEVSEMGFRESFREVLNQPHIVLVVGTIDKDVIGYGLACYHPCFYASGRVAWLEELTVNQSFQSQGIGKKIMDFLESWAGKNQCRLVALATRRAGDFYEKIGYEESANYYRKML